MPTCTATSARSCTASRTNCSRADRLGGLNEPHLVFGKIKAQAYDTAAYKCAADELLLQRGVDILFHAFGAGVVMERDDTIEALIVETKSGRAAVLGRVFIDCSGDGDLAAFAGAPFERGDGAGVMLYPTLMFRLNGVDPKAAGDAWRSIPELMDQLADAVEAGKVTAGGVSNYSADQMRQETLPF
jgi:hypothetical protein